MVSVVKIIELIGESPKSWEEACNSALGVAAKSLRGIVGIDVVKFSCKVEDNKITAFRANVHVAFKYESE
ncbi:MAG: dodecin domain-containing protein [Candidatus Thorarchaeota archaeon]|nr:MAG: dodecin domain-containing protein [Candidatus Thorarchaeota archaeon]